MNIYQLIGDHPFLTFFVVFMVTSTVFKCWNRTMRHLNIRKQGWPPPHCDADGDFKPEPEVKD